MPWPHPNLTDLITDAANDITQSGLPNADGLLRWSVLGVLSRTQAGFAFGMYGYLDWFALQGVPFTATDEFLEAWAAFKGILRLDATAATGPVVFTGVINAVLPDSTPVTRSDGFAFQTVGAATIANNGSLTTTVVATTLGAAGNTAMGTQFSLGNSVVNITANGTAAAALTGGADQEIDDSLRARMLLAFAEPASGGDANDYVQWALAVPGITRAWCNPNGFGAGTVVVYVMLDNSESAYNGFPQGANGVAAAETRDLETFATGDQLAVANAIFPLQPVTALVYVCAPIPLPINFNFVTLSPNSAAMRALIASALAALFLRIGTPLTQTIEQSDWVGAIEAVPGIINFAVSVPVLNAYVPIGYLPTVGTITVGS